MPRGLGNRRDFARKKGEEGLLLVGHEKVIKETGPLSPTGLLPQKFSPQRQGVKADQFKKQKSVIQANGPISCVAAAISS